MSHLTHLRTFLEVYRVRSISQAALNLAITQPTASLHIQAIELFVGKPLFIRQPRGVTSTAAADELARSVAPHLDSIEMKLATYRLGQAEGGTVHIVGPSDFIHNRLASSLATLIPDGFNFRLHTGNKQQIYALLDSGTMDLAITASMPDEHQYAFAHLLTERMMLVFAPSLTRAIGKLTKESLGQTPLIAYDEDLPLVRNLWSSLFQVSPDIKAAFTIPDLRIIKDMVIDGHGWSVLPDYHCQDALSDGRLLAANAVADAPTNHLYLVWQKNGMKSKATAYTRDYILTLFR
ncbi:LysR family transcriptional regulator [Citrobacter sp. JGM124]|uniref:LysR family transcriptional regulator n=1 Tax=Citrobacter sp. JGM124 TaxID=2799789 RepID=UPI001BAD93B8|nr:LysR family transcriptional regulator [Citrobacter sp. JGM124]MBS0849011.1 LysR family transcriptional regulator [Citrobacter sp. JGM124]